VAIQPDPNEVVLRRASVAAKAGCHGIVCSPKEIQTVRRKVGPKLVIVTPGIRPGGAAADDQKRSSTPATAIADGADYLVVGRPIRSAPDPRAAAAQIVEEIASALALG
jgi:orotidine-5'-phosphate decarboxylase